MCLTVKYVCPCCGEESGKSDTWARRHDPCVDHLYITRVMKAEHFEDWFCATEGCEYSKEKQEGWDSAIHAIIETQHPPNPPRDGEAVPATSRQRNPEYSIDIPPPVGRSEPDHDSDMELDSVPEAADVDSSDTGPEKATKPKDDEATEKTENAAKKSKRTPLPSSRPARFNNTSKQPPLGAPSLDNKGNRGAAQSSHTALALFRPSVARRVKELVDKIDVQARAATDPKRWFAEEDELLELLRGQGLKYGTIADDFHLRHSRNACESRASRLKREE